MVYLQTVKSKNAVSYYAAKTVYENGKKTSKIVEKLGTQVELSLLYDDPSKYLKQRIAELTEQEKAQTRDVLVRFAQSECIEANEQKSFNCGYLFLQALYHELIIDQILSFRKNQSCQIGNNQKRFEVALCKPTNF